MRWLREYFSHIELIMGNILGSAWTILYRIFLRIKLHFAWEISTSEYSSLKNFLHESDIFFAGDFCAWIFFSEKQPP
jgi:hypothetical protein